MPEKKGFKQVTIKDFEAKRKEAEEKKLFSKMETYIDEISAVISSQTDKAIVSLLHELGYPEAHEHMTMEEAEVIHAKLLEDGKYINVSSEVDLETATLSVKVSLVQEAKELTFDVSPEEK